MSFSVPELQAYFRELGAAGLQSLFKFAAFQRFEDVLASPHTSPLVAVEHACDALTALTTNLEDQLFLVRKARAFLLAKLAEAQG